MELFRLEVPLVHGIEVGSHCRDWLLYVPLQRVILGCFRAPAHPSDPSRSLSFSPVRAPSLVMMNRMIVRVRRRSYAHDWRS